MFAASRGGTQDGDEQKKKKTWKPNELCKVQVRGATMENAADQYVAQLSAVMIRKNEGENENEREKKITH